MVKYLSYNAIRGNKKNNKKNKRKEINQKLIRNKQEKVYEENEKTIQMVKQKLQTTTWFLLQKSLQFAIECICLYVSYYNKVYKILLQWDTVFKMLKICKQIIT